MWNTYNKVTYNKYSPHSVCGQRLEDDFGSADS